MNIYARIRKIENPKEFKRLFNIVLGAEDKENFEPAKDLKDFGIDGYNKRDKIVYAVYCPEYPERANKQQYIKKINSDIEELSNALKNKKISYEVKKWVFVTPEELFVDVSDHIKQVCEKENWGWGTLTALKLAPLFMKHQNIQIDFPEITAGLYFDKIPNISVYFSRIGTYNVIELFNDGTEHVREIQFMTSEDNCQNWKDTDKHEFLYEESNPVLSKTHKLYNLRMGERQYCMTVPTKGKFHYKLTGIGVESQKTFIKEGFIERLK